MQDVDKHVPLRPQTTLSYYGNTPANTPDGASGSAKIANPIGVSDMEPACGEVEFAVVKHVNDDVTPGMHPVVKHNFNLP